MDSHISPDWLWGHVGETTFPADDRSPVSVDASHAEKETDHMIRLNKAYAHCFSSAEGRVVLSHLRQVTLERALGPDSSDDALRQLEGQRQLVLRIDNIVNKATQTPT